jgi:hypothetical protein
MNATEVVEFLTYLAIQHQVLLSTQNKIINVSLDTGNRPA